MNRRVRGFVSVMAVVLAASLAQADSSLRAQVEAMLAAGIETPVSSDTFAALGPDVVPALIAIYEEENAPRHVRLRALGVLAELDDPRATALLERVVREASTSRTDARTFANTGLVLRRALAGLEARPNLRLSPEQIVPLLEHREATVRERTAQLLTRLAERPDVRRRLEERLAREPSQAVRARLDAALTGRSAPPRALRLVRPRSAQPPR